MASLPHQEGEDGLRERLQLLLDDKEKQLQLAGTLGQRILAQQMELEDRINQLPLSSSSLLNPEDTQQQEDIRDKLKELQGVLTTWEDENASFFSKLAAQAVGCDFIAGFTLFISNTSQMPSLTLRKLLMSFRLRGLHRAHCPWTVVNRQLFKALDAPKTQRTAQMTLVCQISH
jgi:hypothetical protein